MWGKHALERKLASLMGYDYCTLFDTGRSAIKALSQLGYDISIPSNVCPELASILPKAVIVSVSSFTGMAPIPVQMYGYRFMPPIKCNVEIDPLMTGFLREPIAHNKVISFGRKKMLDIGGGGALLSNDNLKLRPWFPRVLREHLAYQLGKLREHLAWQRDRIDNWDRLLEDSCVRIPQEQIMPWRVIRRIPGKRDAVVRALRKAGHTVGTNYPPLPGVTDAGAIQWGNEVINFFPEGHAHEACEIIKGVVDDDYHC